MSYPPRRKGWLLSSRPWPIGWCVVLAVSTVFAQSVKGPFVQPAGVAVSPGAWAQEFPVAAARGLQSVVAWEDYRDDFFRSDVYAAVVGSNGQVILSPFAVGTGPWSQRRPAVGCAVDSTCLFAWADEGPVSRVWTRRLRADGVLEAPVRIDGGGPIDGVSAVAVTATDTGFAVAWAQVPAALFLARLDPQGAVTTPATVLTVSAAEISNVGLAQLGNVTEVFWYSATGYQVAQVDNGVPALSNTHVLGQTSTWNFGQLITRDDALLAAWTEFNGAMNQTTLYAQHIESNGALREAAKVPLVTEPTSLVPFAVAPLVTNTVDLLVAFGAANYTTGWNRYSPSLMVQQAGTVVDTAAARLALSGAAVPMLFRESVGNDSSLGFVSMGAAGALDGGERTFAGGVAQLFPSVAAGRDGGVVVWTEDVGLAYRIRAAFVDRDGQPQPAITVSDRPTLLTSAQAVFTGSEYVVAWPNQYNTAVSMKRFSLDGQPLDTSEVDVGTTGVYAEVGVASHAGVTFFGWSADVAGKHDFYLRRLAPDGGWLDASPRVIASPFNQFCPSAGATDDGFVASCHSRILAPIEVRSFGVDGGLSATTAIDAGVTALAAASSSFGTLVAWFGPLASPQPLWLSRIAADGSLIDTEPLAVDARPFGVNRWAPAPAVTFDGQAYQVAWPTESDDGGADLSVMTVPVTGAAGPVRVLAGAAATEEMPALTAFSPGRLLLAYVTSTANGLRVATRVDSAVPLGATCFDDGECQSGRCVFEVCALGAGSGGGAGGGATLSGPVHWKVGCDCDAAPSVLLGALGVLGWVLRRRRRRTL